MSKDIIERPEHYTKYPIEVIDMMVRIWGKQKVKIYCEINAFKYQMRMGDKGPIQEDYLKRNWYLNKAKELD